MEMQVLHGLAGLIAAVVDDAVILAAQVCTDLGDDLKAMRHDVGVAAIDLAGAADVLLGHHQEMGGRLRVDVIEGVAQLVLVDLIGGDLPGNNGAEQAIVLDRKSVV